ncbi:flavin reductase family protein [Knoellia sp. CPCC 206453]|uniref:flavin reductase family protein n=1 Tax=Knoellia pratensis TaxID=3404796 RepID=UPI00361D9C99
MTVTQLPTTPVLHEGIDPAILYFGTPVVLVSTTNSDGTSNLAPVSSVFWLGRTAVLGFGLASHTVANLRRERECVLNLPSASLVGAVDRLALTTGAPVVNQAKAGRGYVHVKDKFAHAGLAPRPSETVAPPGVMECPVVLESTLLAIHTTDFHLVQVEVGRTFIHPGLRLEGHDNRIDPERWRPLIMSFQRFFGLGDEVHPSRLASIDEEMYR